MSDDGEIPLELADGSCPMAPAELFRRLDELQIEHRTVDHPPLFTVEDSKQLRGVLPGAHIKNLFLRNKKGRMWLLTCLEDRQIDLKMFAQSVGAGRFSFCSPQRLMHHLGVSPGAVTPLAPINDRLLKVTVLLDSALRNCDPLNVHPLHNAQTTALSFDDLLVFLAACDHQPEFVDLDNI